MMMITMTMMMMIRVTIAMTRVASERDGTAHYNHDNDDDDDDDDCYDKDGSMVRRVSGTAWFLRGVRGATQGMYDTLAGGRKDK